MKEISSTAFGIGITAIFESQIFPFMLSSAFTARTIAQEKQQVQDVKQDVMISMLISEGFSVLMSLLLNDSGTMIFGTLFAIMLVAVYEWRGDLLSTTS